MHPDRGQTGEVLHLWRPGAPGAGHLELSILVKANITVTKPPSATERADLPGKILRRT